MNNGHKKITLPRVNWTQYYTLMALKLIFYFFFPYERKEF